VPLLLETPAVWIAQNEEQNRFDALKMKTPWSEDPKSTNYKYCISSDKKILCCFQPRDAASTGRMYSNSVSLLMIYLTTSYQYHPMAMYKHKWWISNHVGKAVVTYFNLLRECCWHSASQSNVKWVPVSDTAFSRRYGLWDKPQLI
jgi:hypothetical protein